MQPVAEVLVVCNGCEKDEKTELAHMNRHSSRHPSPILPYPANPGYLQELAHVQPDHAAQWVTFLKRKIFRSLVVNIVFNSKYLVKCWANTVLMQSMVGLGWAMGHGSTIRVNEHLS